MKLIIDTEKKTVVVHGSCAFEAIEAAVKAVDPENWPLYALTCENVSISLPCEPTKFKYPSFEDRR
jgi:hypothetical protein